MGKRLLTSDEPTRALCEAPQDVSSLLLSRAQPDIGTAWRYNNRELFARETAVALCLALCELTANNNGAALAPVDTVIMLLGLKDRVSSGGLYQNALTLVSSTPPEVFEQFVAESSLEELFSIPRRAHGAVTLSLNGNDYLASVEDGSSAPAIALLITARDFNGNNAETLSTTTDSAGNFEVGLSQEEVGSFEFFLPDLQEVRSAEINRVPQRFASLTVELQLSQRDRSLDTVTVVFDEPPPPAPDSSAGNTPSPTNGDRPDDKETPKTPEVPSEDEALPEPEATPVPTLPLPPEDPSAPAPAPAPAPEDTLNLEVTEFVLVDIRDPTNPRDLTVLRNGETYYWDIFGTKSMSVRVNTSAGVQSVLFEASDLKSPNFDTSRPFVVYGNDSLTGKYKSHLF